MATSSWQDELRDSRLITWLRAGAGHDALLLGHPAASKSYARFESLFERYLQIGGMPAVHDPDLDDDQVVGWLRDFERTYLERDVADLAALRDLEPFVLAQKGLAARTGRLVNFSDLARAAGIAPATAQRFLRYLEVSYQALELRPFFRNQEKRLARMPKLHFLDPGILRALLNRRGELTGEEFESAVVAELYKQVRSAGLAAQFYHLRTHDRREVDLLIELEAGFVAVEVKKADRVAPADASAFRNLEQFLDRPLLKCLLLSTDRDARPISDHVIALPTAWALSPPEAGEDCKMQ